MLETYNMHNINTSNAVYYSKQRQIGWIRYVVNWIECAIILLT